MINRVFQSGRTIQKAMVRLVILSATCLGVTQPVQAKSQPARPNFLLIVADDLGYSDIGAFGGEIATPNLDEIARRGVRLTSFYTAPTCSPTRAMLLTGRDHHEVGLGTMEEVLPSAPALQGRPGYTGHLDRAIPTVAERLQAIGYRTMMSGKWHLGRQPEYNPAQRGFQQSYALLQGGADHFGDDQTELFGAMRPTYTENGKPATFPTRRYSTNHFTDKMLGFLKQGSKRRKPFFAYLAFTAPHWPIQAPEDIIDKYRGRYDQGPAVLRANRLERMRALGLLDEKILGARLEALDDWDQLTPQQRAVASRAMEVYAAMVDSLDANVGRLLTALRKSGDLENTVIIFMSDNGAEGVSQAEIARAMQQFGMPAETVAALNAANADPQKMGRPGSYVAYGPQWAQVGAAPFHLFKGFTDEGGIRSPAFIAGPGVKGSRVVNSLTSVRDIMPTLLTMAGAATDAGATVAERSASKTPKGKSLVPILTGVSDTVRGDQDVMAWELFFRRGVRIGDWKAVYRSANVSTSYSTDGMQSPMRWHLFDLAADPGESTDLSDAHPDMLQRLVQAWDEYARENGVYVPK